MITNRRLAYSIPIEVLRIEQEHEEENLRKEEEEIDIPLEAMKRYIKSANHCPFCKKEDGGAWIGDEWIDGTDKQKPTVKVKFQCASCNKKYTEIYKLFKVQREKKKEEGEEE